MMVLSEFLKSWTPSEMVFGTGSEAEVTQALLHDLQRRAELLGA